MEKDKGRRALLFLLIGSTLLGALGQLLFKVALAYYGMLFIGYLALGLAAYGISTFIYLHVLGRTHLSWAYSFGGLSYIFASVLAVIVLGERVSPLRWLGIVIIAIGTAFIAVS